MFKLDHKSILIGASVVAGTSLLLTGCLPSSSGMNETPAKVQVKTSSVVGPYAGKMGAVDGGVTYPRENGRYTAYRYNEQSTKGINHGRVPTANELKAWDVDIMPDGTGLPDGEGSVEEGDELYEAQCASCHGEFGAGGKGYPQLTGGNQEKDANGVIKTLKNQRLVPGMDAPKRTVGTFWPKASTLIWYIRDAMPYAHPKSLTDNEIYAMTAYILAQNGIVIDGEKMTDEYVLNREKFMKIKMPNENGFYPNIDGPDGVENVRAFFADRAKNIGAGTRCMTDCKDPGMASAGAKEATVMSIDYEMKDVVPPYSMVRDLPPEVEDKAISKGEKLYNTSCKLCHATDQMGAPVVGDVEEWRKITEKGFEKVVINAIEGMGGMPPKGGNEDLTNTEVKTIVEFMVNSSKNQH